VLAQRQRALVLVALVVATLAVVARAEGSTNALSGSSAGTSAQSIGANDLKPPTCAGVTLTTLIAGTIGTAGNDLVLGSASPELLTGSTGNDCILGGGGADIIDGGLGTDVCVGGPGTDTFLNCETTIQ
jgi:Ca2+-binding RTX toxin-like protein